ncbi:class I SAM-dependent methyltransferase [Streptomyces sp. HNM0574]|uniref:methyltransferase domain-containing protein n=1 Tax=Streptomyces sp. HNM0574 TaxID=2714954 RepID=UPI00146D139C|nr:class I SAM-dependent methyltransferase [Streptomyces sp. HNM0574]
MNQPTATTDRPATGYAFDNATDHSHDQHRCLAAAYDPVTLPRLAATGLRSGWDCLEVGAGGGSVAQWLARRVAPHGTVLATDVDPRHIASAPGLTVRAHDLERDPLPENAFDLVVARLVLQHLPGRRAVLAKLVRALRPGGVLQIDEFDTSYEPPLLAPDEESAELYSAFLRAKSDALRAAGGDPQWGRRVPSALREAGLVGIDTQPYVEVRHAGSASLQLQLHHTHHLRDRLVAQGMTPAQLERVRELMTDPSFRAASSILYSTQGRRPEGRDPR